ncbi:MAG: M24 family metallopeptidase [Pirellulales bacterium]
MIDLAAMQQALREQQLDGWLFYDFRGTNPLALRVLGFGEQPVGTRRFFYFVPATGAPRKLVHRIEMAALDALPGEKESYLRWQELEAGVGRLLAGSSRVAMEYSPRAGNPYVAKVDAGTIELVQSHGVEVISSGDLIQLFEATWDDEQWAMHLEAARHTETAFQRAWTYIARQVQTSGSVRECQVQQVILDHFQEHGLVTSHPPIVGVGPHSGDPHYEPTPATDTPMREGDFVLIDLWAKVGRPRSVYSDLTQVGYIGRETPARYEEVFRIVANARDAAIERVRHAFAADEPLLGWQVDQAARDVIDRAGHGAAFIHRTGHSIGQETHGNGANMDNLETHEERRVMRRTCFSIEPGIYLPEFGVRSETNVFIDATGQVHVTGGALQQQVLKVLARPC